MKSPHDVKKNQLAERFRDQVPRGNSRAWREKERGGKERVYISIPSERGGIFVLDISYARSGSRSVAE